MKLLLLLILAFIRINIYSQNFDSLYYEFLHLTKIETVKKSKCGFGILAEIKENIGKYDVAEQDKYTSLFVRPQLQTYVDSYDGKFRIHFDTTGINQPQYSIDELIFALDTVCAIEFANAGFPFPPEDFNNNGGSSAYDIYIQKLSGYYGYTTPEDVISVFDSTYTSFLVINSDFSGFYTEGIDAAKVTLAHELHHAVQIGNYKMRFSDLYFYELTSTSMEEFVFPYVNDYLAYLNEFFLNTDMAFPDHSGYDLSIWNFFIKDEFGFPTIVTQWEKMKNQRAAFAIRNSIEEEGVNFVNVFKEFGTRVFFTSYRASVRKYFNDAQNFPVARNKIEINFPPSYTKEFSLPPFSLAYVSAVSNNDSITFLTTNANLSNLFPAPYQISDYAITFYDNTNNGENSIANKYSFDFSSSDDFSTYEIFLNNDFVSSIEESGNFAYPQPFLVNKHKKLFLPLTGNYPEVELSIYTNDMILVKHLRLTKNVSENYLVLENKDLNIPTGIYIFIISHNRTIAKGKIAVINNR